jgi:hypothetical protein
MRPRAWSHAYLDFYEGGYILNIFRIKWPVFFSILALILLGVLLLGVLEWQMEKDIQAQVDSPQSSAANVTDSAEAETELQDKFVWCYSITQQDEEGNIIEMFGHRPGDDIQNVPTECFSTWSQAAAFVSDGAIQLPEEATEQDYTAAVGSLNGGMPEPSDSRLSD